MAKRSSILGLALEGEDIGTAFQNLYTAWRETNSDSGETFVQLFSSFRDRKILASLDGGALKLYLYYCFAAKNLTGESWYSVDKITEYFGKQQKRTIEGWNRELREKQLIYRERIDKKSHTTFLIPYSNTIVDLEPPRKSPDEDQTLLNSFITKLTRLEVVYGKIIGVYHLFQWGVRKRNVSSATNSQYLFILTRRDNDILIGHRYELSEHDDYGISQLEIEGTCRFDSHFTWNSEPVQGLSFEHTLKFLRSSQTSMKNWLKLILELSSTDRLYTLSEVQYGLTGSVLVDELEDENDESTADSED